MFMAIYPIVVEIFYSYSLFQRTADSSSGDGVGH